ncbi:isochorismate synthase [Lutibacter flavus]|uniref:isochorismate synthase n=1 Tax=Lutibacter flavus TaxID=691689 RepID=A0A238VW71_9FLAO|nr:isochorismate synthase [Lutibacter flavus]SNR38582.1 isochorismate synthase [Lutibacter flavus]
MQQTNEIFFDKIETVFNSNFPFIVFRKPNENKVTALCQKTNELFELKSFDQSGFIFAPFNKNGLKIIFPLEKCDVLITNLDNDFELNEKSTVLKSTTKDNAQVNHISIIEKAVEFIKSNKAKKIVLSRKETLESDTIDVIYTLKQMLNNYKNAFVYVWFHPKIGLWMGATPERLISISENKLKTMSLAGTQKFKGTLDVIWQEKELHEQRYVTDYIVENIKPKLTSFKTVGPYTVQAGSLLHLRTDISGTLKSSNLLETLINSLHPTPAICGIPKKVATDFILEHEGYNRAYYSGYLGELNMNNSTNLFVNLRCMQLENNSASIFVGGGITCKSIAENEWVETVSKAEIMRKVL